MKTVRKFNSNQRAAIAVYMIIICALLNGGYMVMKSVKGYQNRNSEIASAQERLHPLKKMIFNRETVGYISDLERDSIEYVTAYFQAQYVLAPVILERHGDKEMVVGNFFRPASEKSLSLFEQQRHLEMVKRFENGVVLFRKAEN